MRKKTPTSFYSKEDVGYIYGADKTLEDVQRAARNRDSMQGGQKVREVFRRTPKERVTDDLSIIPRAGNTQREACLLATQRTPPRRITDRPVFGASYAPVSHGITNPVRAFPEGFEIRDSIPEYEKAEKEKWADSESKWKKLGL